MAIDRRCIERDVVGIGIGRGLGGERHGAIGGCDRALAFGLELGGLFGLCGIIGSLLSRELVGSLLL